MRMRMSKESKRKNSETQKGRVNYTWLGRKHSEESKKKIALARSNGPILCIELNIVFESMHDAARKLDLHHAAIWAYIHGNRRSSVEGYTFKYA